MSSQPSPPLLAIKAALQATSLPFQVNGVDYYAKLTLHPECGLMSHKDVIVIAPVKLDGYEQQREQWDKFLDMLSVPWLESYLAERRERETTGV